MTSNPRHSLPPRLMAHEPTRFATAQESKPSPSPGIRMTRKNALFAGSDGGAAHWAVIASLVETCKLIGVEPRAYLADVITRIITGHPQSRLDELLPWAYPTTPDLKAVA